jgi:hypothetical protein
MALMAMNDFSMTNLGEQCARNGIITLPAHIPGRPNDADTETALPMQALACTKGQQSGRSLVGHVPGQLEGVPFGSAHDSINGAEERRHNVKHWSLTVQDVTRAFSP